MLMQRNFTNETTHLLVNYQTMSMLRTFAQSITTLWYTFVVGHYTFVDPLQNMAMLRTFANELLYCATTFGDQLPEIARAPHFC
jgi:hypothetical protein